MKERVMKRNEISNQTRIDGKSNELAHGIMVFITHA